VVEVVWNVGQNFRTEREKLDNFSTFARSARKRGFLAGLEKIAACFSLKVGTARWIDIGTSKWLW
jgi:hypothetical protein